VHHGTADVPVLAWTVGPLKYVGERAVDYREGRGQGGTLGGHLGQQVRVQAHAVLERIDLCLHRRRSARGLLGVHRNPAARGMDDAALPQRMEVDHVRIWQAPR